MSRRVLQLLSAVAAALVAGAAAHGAHAYSSGDVAARLDEQIKPNFGILLHPPLYHHHFHYGIWYGRRYGWGRGYYESYGRAYGAPYGPSPYSAGAASITVDCADTAYSRTPISDAAAYVADGGVVYVRSHGQPCRETIEIDHPVVIAGEDASAFSVEPGRARVVIAAPDGQPCVLVAQGVKQVELRGLQLESNAGGQSSCVEAWDSEVALVRDDVDYSGDGSAVYISGGRLIVRESRIDAHTYDAAIFADGAELQMFKDRIRADTLGVDLTLGPAESKIDHVGVLATRSAGQGSVGITVRGERSGGALLKVDDAVICGFRVGIGFERGGRGLVRRSRVCRASFGVMSEGASIEVSESAIGGDHFGVYVASGDAKVSHNRIYDLSDPADGVYAEPPAGLVEELNWFYLRPGCERFHWDGRRYCRSEAELPGWFHDESGFDRDYADAWDVDGYEDGYMRDGPVVAFDPHPPRRGGGLFGGHDGGREGVRDGGFGPRR